jgi:hypothetical protein
LADKAEISEARRALAELAVPVVLVIAVGLAVPVVLVIAVGLAAPAALVIAAGLAVPVVIASAIAVLATPLLWVIAADLAAGQAATTGPVLVPAAVAAHPAWEVSVAVEAGADLAAAAEAVVVCEAAVCAEAGAAEGKHHEHKKRHREFHDFEFALAQTSGRCRDSSAAARLSADLRGSCRRTDNSWK